MIEFLLAFAWNLVRGLSFGLLCVLGWYIAWRLVFHAFFVAKERYERNS